MTRIFIISILISLLISCSSQKHKFKIDNSISPGIDSIFKANLLFVSPMTNGVLFHVKKTFDFERFGQNGIGLAYFLKKHGYKSTDVYVSAMTECYLDKDSIILFGALDDETGLGVKISLYNDKCNSQLRLIAREKIYSKTENKNDLQKDIVLNPDRIFLTLTEKPKFKTGSSLKGKMEVTFEAFYQVDSSNRLSKITPRFDIIFDTEIN